MSINIRDRNIIVMYIQIFLKERYPEAIVKTIIKDRYGREQETKVNLLKKPFKVTGTYDLPTYLLLSCYMNLYYPNEKYPYEAIIEDGVYKGYQDFSGDKSLYDVLTENLRLYQKDRNLIKIPDRVLSYILREVVTDQSSDDEIFRIQKLIYNPAKIPNEEIGKFSDSLRKSVIDIQEEFIKSHTYKIVENHELTDKTEVRFPDNYEGFKVTGYIDPWTEVLYEQ